MAEPGDGKKKRSEAISGWGSRSRWDCAHAKGCFNTVTARQDTQLRETLTLKTMEVLNKTKTAEEN